jgi:hypothetical protein
VGCGVLNSKIVSFGLKTRHGHYSFKDDVKLPPEFVAEVKAYHAEKRLLDIIKAAGYDAEVLLNEEDHPIELRIRVPAGKDPGGYPDKDEYFIIKPSLANSTILSVEHNLKAKS